MLKLVDIKNCEHEASLGHNTYGSLKFCIARIFIWPFLIFTVQFGLWTFTAYNCYGSAANNDSNQVHNNTNLVKQEYERTCIRDTLKKLIRSGYFEQLMEEANISSNGSDYISIKSIQFIRNALLKSAELSWETASIAAKETATAITFDTIAEIQKRRQEEYRRFKRIIETSEYKDLLRKYTKGFDTLSNEFVFMDERGMNKLAEKIIEKAYPDDAEFVKKELLSDINKKLITNAQQSKVLFRRYVRYIVFGTKNFGTRDTFLSHKSTEARQQAIEKVLYRMIRQHPKYQHARRDAPYVKKIVSKQAKDLTEIIKDVP